MSNYFSCIVKQERMMGENELGQGLAHMMAAPAPTTERQHISDAAWQAYTAAVPNMSNARELMEECRRRDGTVLLTVAEHDALIQKIVSLSDKYDGAAEKLADIGLNCDVVPAIKHFDVCAERDSLRAEVERLRVQLAGCDVASRANTRQSLDEAKSLEPYSYGWSPAYESVLEAMAREIALREDNERLRKGRDERVREATDRGDQMVGPRPMRRWAPIL